MQINEFCTCYVIYSVWMLNGTNRCTNEYILIARIKFAEVCSHKVNYATLYYFFIFLFYITYASKHSKGFPELLPLYNIVFKHSLHIYASNTQFLNQLIIFCTPINKLYFESFLRRLNTFQFELLFWELLWDLKSLIKQRIYTHDALMFVLETQKKFQSKRCLSLAKKKKKKK